MPTINLDHEIQLAMGHLPPDVRKAVGSLTPRQRQVTVMVFIHGWSMPELARELGVSKDTVKEYCEVSISKIQKNMKVIPPCK